MSNKMNMGVLAPWDSAELKRQASTFTASPQGKQVDPQALIVGASFHLDFLDHHLAHALFPASDGALNPSGAFSANADRRYLSVVAASSRPEEAASGDGIALNQFSPLAQAGKPVMNQSALHGFHVFEGLQLVSKQEDEGYSFGYTFADEKTVKLVDGIIRLRFAVHLLQAGVLTRHLQDSGHARADEFRKRFDRILNEALPQRRAEAEDMVRDALRQFALANRAEMEAELKRCPEACFYVRIEAQGGNRESIGQGPIGVGQSTIQVLGQHARKNLNPTDVVMNPAAPPRIQALSGPFVNHAFYPLLNNRAVHHGNMGHQHLSSEMAQPHGSDMLLSTAEIDADGRLQSMIAETNFSNIGFLRDGQILFPKSDSATYGLTQHVLRGLLREALEKGQSLEGITGVVHERLSTDQFLHQLRSGNITAAFLMGSMPGVQAVGNIHVDETLTTGAFTTFPMKAESIVMKTLRQLYMNAYNRSIVWL